MSSLPKHTPPEPRTSETGAGTSLTPISAALVGWLVPGGAHLMLGQTRRAVVFFCVLVAMMIIGIAAGGRLFPFEVGEPLVFLEAAAQWALVLPRIIAGLGGYGTGVVTSPTYEYGNTFLISAGLLNTLIVLDAYDVAARRKVS